MGDIRFNANSSAVTIPVSLPATFSLLYYDLIDLSSNFGLEFWGKRSKTEMRQVLWEESLDEATALLEEKTTTLVSLGRPG
jgi:hypothetical protein